MDDDIFVSLGTLTGKTTSIEQTPRVAAKVWQDEIEVPCMWRFRADVLLVWSKAVGGELICTGTLHFSKLFKKNGEVVETPTDKNFFDMRRSDIMVLRCDWAGATKVDGTPLWGPEAMKRLINGKAAEVVETRPVPVLTDRQREIVLEALKLASGLLTASDDDLDEIVALFSADPVDERDMMHG